MGKKRGSLICIIGVDGSGKTTLSKHIVETLNREYRCQFRYVHGMVKPVFFRKITKFGRILVISKQSNKDLNKFQEAKKGLFAEHSSISRLYSFLTYFETIPQLLLKIVLPLIRGENVLADRYFIDMIVDLAVFLNYCEDDIQGELNKYKLILPWPDLLFHIDLSPEIAFMRKEDVSTVGYIEERREIYNKLSKLYSAIVLDGEKDIINLEKEVLTQLKEIGIIAR